MKQHVAFHCLPRIGRRREVGRGKWGEEAGKVVAFIIETGRRFAAVESLAISRCAINRLYLLGLLEADKACSASSKLRLYYFSNSLKSVLFLENN